MHFLQFCRVIKSLTEIHFYMKRPRLTLPHAYKMTNDSIQFLNIPYKICKFVRKTSFHILIKLFLLCRICSVVNFLFELKLKQTNHNSIMKLGSLCKSKTNKKNQKNKNKNKNREKGEKKKIKENKK